MADVRLASVRKDFGSITAVEPIDLTFRHGELTALLGPSGCGKTTLLRMIAGLEAPTGGRIFLGDADITELPAHKRKFGMVFQSFALFPHLNVAENISYSLRIGGMAKAACAERAAKLLDLVQLSAFADRRIGELSGGQRQRVAIARALAQEPDVFLLDEPMSALDAKLREEMQVELRLLQQRLGITTIVVTHDQREAMTMADNVVVMSAGRAEQVGPPQDIYHRPANAFIASFIGRANFLDGVVADGHVRIGEHEIRLDPLAKFQNNAPVTLAVRPEKVGLQDETPDATRVPATVTFVRDVGSTRDIYLKTPVGDLIVEYALGETSRDFHVGDEVQAEIPPGGCHVFPREARAS